MLGLSLYLLGVSQILSMLESIAGIPPRDKRLYIYLTLPVDWGTLNKIDYF